MKRCAGMAAAAALMILAGTGIAGAVVALVPHKAIYEISLSSAKTGSGIESVTGNMLAEWAESCEGWTMDHRSRFDVTFSDGPEIRILSEISTWESRDGLTYRFTVRNKTGDEAEELTAGMAKLDGKGKGGFAELSEPNRDRSRLPAGTVFPTDHSIRILEAARHAPTVVSMVLFDGLSELKSYLINAVIGPPGRSPHDARMKALQGKRWWPLQMAFFALGSPEAAPEQEYGVRFYENGVGDRLTIDFGDFKVRADLVRLEMGKKPACGE